MTGVAFYHKNKSVSSSPTEGTSQLLPSPWVTNPSRVETVRMNRTNLSLTRFGNRTMSQRIPTLCGHRSAKGNRADVELGGGRVYVAASGAPKPPKRNTTARLPLSLRARTLPKSGSDLTIAELIVRYAQYTKRY